jgi:uncharacterized protein
MKIDYDQRKRASNLRKHGFDFEDARVVFGGPTYNEPDNRRDYGEPRVRTLGFLAGRLVSVVWTPRNGARRIISMRKANAREKARVGHRLGEG